MTTELCVRTLVVCAAHTVEQWPVSCVGGALGWGCGSSVLVSREARGLWLPQGTDRSHTSRYGCDPNPDGCPPLSAVQGAATGLRRWKGQRATPQSAHPPETAGMTAPDAHGAFPTAGTDPVAFCPPAPVAVMFSCTRPKRYGVQTIRGPK